jgi:hypothetical protein
MITNRTWCRQNEIWWKGINDRILLRCSRYDFVSDLRQVGVFFRVLRIPPPRKLTTMLKMALNTISKTSYAILPVKGMSYKPMHAIIWKWSFLFQTGNIWIK